MFARVTDFLYVGRDTELTITCDARRRDRRALRHVRRPAAAPGYGAAEDVAIEIRGAGPATRQVTNFGSPEAWPHADRLMCVELLTPDGNWSSYPPHKHDDSPECPVNNEEIYYFRIGVAGSTDYAPEGFGLHRTYTGDGRIDDNLTVTDGDVYLIPRGYHGPCVAAPGLHDVLPQRARRARAASARWRSATTRPITGCASRGKGWRPTRVVR